MDFLIVLTIWFALAIVVSLFMCNIFKLNKKDEAKDATFIYRI